MAAVITDGLTELDFTPVLPCEHSQHEERHRGDEPASVMMQVVCPGCAVPAQFLMCLPGYSKYVNGPVQDGDGCGGVFPGRQWVVGVIPCG